MAHEVTDVGNDRAQLASMAKQANEILGKEHMEVFADRGYYSGPEILACEESGMVSLVPKPLTSGNRAKGLFDNATSDICPIAMSFNALLENAQSDDLVRLRKGYCSTNTGRHLVPSAR